MNLSEQFWKLTDKIFPKTPQQKRDERRERLDSLDTELREKWKVFSQDSSKFSSMDGWIRGDKTTSDDRIQTLFNLFAGAIKDGGGSDLVKINSSELVHIKGSPYIITSIFRLGSLTPFPVPAEMYRFIYPVSSYP